MTKLDDSVLQELPMWTQISVIGENIGKTNSDGTMREPKIYGNLAGRVVTVKKWPIWNDVEMEVSLLAKDGVNAAAVVHDDAHTEVLRCFRILPEGFKEISAETFNDLYGFPPRDYIGFTKVAYRR
jgi:uncharacterized protein with ATP-grasp and redox domains